MGGSDNYYSFVQEKKYIEGLGAWSSYSWRSRRWLLRKYIETIRRRDALWVEKARDYARVQLFNEYGEYIR